MIHAMDYNGYFSGRTALVTGGAGFIGSHLTQHLERLGCNVHVLDDFSSGYRDNLEGTAALCFEGSILDQSLLQEAIQGCSFVFHEAALVSVPLSIEDPQLCYEINDTGTANVVKAAEESVDCSRVIFASSAACYGNSPTLPSAETDPVSPESPYATCKFAGEQLLEKRATSKFIDAVSLRYFNVFGLRQDPHSQYAAVVSAFIEAIQNNRVPMMFGDGSQTRDFTHVDNIVHANLLAASHQHLLLGAVFNVGTGVATSLLDLLRSITNELNPAVDYQPPRSGDIQHSCADITAIQNVLGYTPIVQTSEGIRALVNLTSER